VAAGHHDRAAVSAVSAEAISPQLMLSLSTAQKLKEAGLTWKPALHDFFAIPGRGFDDRVFVVSDVFANVEWLRGHLAVTFHGSVEWALDYMLVADLVWLPTETQLRQELERRLVTKRESGMKLISGKDGYVCECRVQDKWLRFEASEASEAYASALLYVLGND
jgi:hypothetical protein